MLSLFMASRWSQFVSMALAQLSGRISLRDVVSNLSAQARKLYPLGAVPVSRSSLARINEKQPYALYEALFANFLSLANVKRPAIAWLNAVKFYLFSHQCRLGECLWDSSEQNYIFHPVTLNY